MKTNTLMKTQVQQFNIDPSLQSPSRRNGGGGGVIPGNRKLLSSSLRTSCHLLLLWLALASRAWAGYTVVDAANAGLISLSGYASSGFSEAVLYVDVKCGYAIDVDFSTVWCVQGNASQRIGLCYEKSTGAYNLHLRAHCSYTLYFSSRCLDHSRSSPSSGGWFTTFYSFSSQFNQIRDALRNAASQSYIWDLTDNSGSFSQAWKRADPRGSNTPTPPSDTGVDISGTVSWATSGSSINISATKVMNLSYTSSTGSLRLQIWATRSRYTGGTISGYVLGRRNLNPLQPRYYYSNISGSVSYTRPPRGTYYTTITVEEYTSSGWVIRDYINFNGTKQF
jgi:hypothetical protein